MERKNLKNQIRTRTSQWAKQPWDLSVRVLLAIPFAAMLLITGLNFRVIGDEFYHNLSIESFAIEWPTPNISDYPTTSTPLSYILWTIFGKVVGFEHWKMRLLTAIVTYLAMNAFYHLCKQQKLPYPLFSTLLLLFFPYTFFHGFTIYTDSFGLLFGVWALQYYLLKDPSRGQLLMGSLLATLAVYCRQSYLILPAGMLLFELYHIPWRDFFRTVRQRIGSWLILSLPLLLVLPVFFLWGGYTTPSHQSAQGGDQFVQFVLEHLNFLPIFVGFYFLPMLFSSQTIEILRSRKTALLALVALIPFYFLFTPVYSEEIDLMAAMTGIIGHGVNILGQKLGNPVSATALFVLWIVGVLIILGEVIDFPWSSVKSKLLALQAAFLIQIAFMPYVGERYYALAVPCLILLLHRSFRQRRLVLLWLAVQITLSVGFSYWQIALKSFEAWGWSAY